MRVTRRLPSLAESQPASGSATTAPAATPKRASPSPDFVASSRSCSAGIRATQLPYEAPLAKKTTVTAVRAARGIRPL
jgi:hypothetical protein